MKRLPMRHWAVFWLLATQVLAYAQASIVPPAAQISEQEARTELVRLLADLGRVWEAAAQANMLLEDTPTHTRRTLTLSSAMMTWGDFYRVEAMLRELLARSDLSPAERRLVQLEFARVLIASQRYEEAESELKQLLRDDRSDRAVWAELLRLYVEEKDFKAALDLLAEPTPAAPTRAAQLREQAQVLLQAGRLEAALERQTDLNASGSRTAADSIREVRILRRLEREAEAAEVVERLLAVQPDLLEARYLHTAIGAPEEAEALCSDDAFLLTSEQRLKWGLWLSQDGRPEAAVDCFEAVLAREPGQFQASLALAESLATLGEREQALEVLEQLLAELPAASKLRLTQARVLSWDERYQDSLETYDQLREEQPEDPVPAREAARVAMWSKQPQLASDYYGAMQVSRQAPHFAPEVVALRNQVRSTELDDALAELERELHEGRVYPALAAVAKASEKAHDQESPAVSGALDALLTELRPLYRIQRNAVLEERAKLQAWNRRFRRASDTFVELIEVQPGNQEALFDLAQARCAIGLHDQSLTSYRRLLELDPLHSRASNAAERIEIRSAPALGLAADAWSEDSPGGSRLAAMDRQHLELVGELPLRNDRYRLRVSQHLWWEQPQSLGDAPADAQLTGSYQAQGQGLSFGGVFTRWLRAEMAWTRKDYRSSSLDDPDLFRAAVHMNVRDLADVSLAVLREQVLSNGLSLAQGITVDLARLEVAAPLNRQVDLALLGEWQDYSDDNHGVRLRGDLGVVFSDHPRELKLTLSGEYRDVAEENVFFYDGPLLTGIEHPYWTPQGYFAGDLTLQWRHDLSALKFCGARQHVYLLKLGVGTDTDSNAGVRLAGEYRFDFAPRWSINAEAFIERSEQWNAEGLWLNLTHRF